MICYINTGEYWYNPDYNYPLTKNRTKNYNYCIECGTIISRRATRCVNCNRLYRQKVDNRPSREELKHLIRTQTLVKIGQ